MHDTVNITILVNNTSDERLIAEHGLAFWIEIRGSRILMDTGQGKTLEHNAALLGVNLADAGALVLSHGHYDHSGGISHVLKITPHIDIYCHPDAVASRYRIKSADEVKEIAMPRDSKASLDALSSDQLHWVTKPKLIAPGVGITGPIARKSEFEDTGGPFFLDSDGRRADPIDDDQALWIRTPRGLIIVVGCSHAGLTNTIGAIREISGEKSVIALIGGFHLQDASEDRLSKTTAVLQDFGIETIIPCHCTGERAITLFQAVLGGRVIPGLAGMKISV